MNYDQFQPAYQSGWEASPPIPTSRGTRSSPNRKRAGPIAEVTPRSPGATPAMRPGTPGTHTSGRLLLDQRRGLIRLDDWSFQVWSDPRNNYLARRAKPPGLRVFPTRHGPLFRPLRKNFSGRGILRVLTSLVPATISNPDRPIRRGPLPPDPPTGPISISHLLRRDVFMLRSTRLALLVSLATVSLPGFTLLAQQPCRPLDHRSPQDRGRRRLLRLTQSIASRKRPSTSRR